MRKLILSLLLVSGVSNASVTAVSLEATTANLMYNGCTFQKAGETLRSTMREVNPTNDENVATFVKVGYKYAIDNPRTGCNQILLNMIDHIVAEKGKA